MRGRRGRLRHRRCALACQAHPRERRRDPHRLVAPRRRRRARGLGGAVRRLAPDRLPRPRDPIPACRAAVRSPAARASSRAGGRSRPRTPAAGSRAAVTRARTSRAARATARARAPPTRAMAARLRSAGRQAARRLEAHRFRRVLDAEVDRDRFGLRGRRVRGAARASRSAPRPNTARAIAASSSSPRGRRRRRPGARRRLWPSADRARAPRPSARAIR